VGAHVILDVALHCAVQLREHVGVQIAASGFHQVRFCYSPCLSFPNAVVGKMLRRISILVHRRVDVLHDPRLQEVESMIGHRCATKNVYKLYRLNPAYLGFELTKGSRRLLTRYAAP